MMMMTLIPMIMHDDDDDDDDDDHARTVIGSLPGCRPFQALSGTAVQMTGGGSICWLRSRHQPYACITSSRVGARMIACRYGTTGGEPLPVMSVEPLD
jgi:hypothetical protein